MLNGKDLGAAIGEAIRLKIESGAVRSKAEIARHFGVRPPSLVDWVNKGSISKDKLPELWRFFSDVVGCDHWGMSDAEWPSGLSETPSPHPHTEPGDARLPIRRVLFRLSAGVSGYEIEYEDGESEPIFMARRWFDRHGYRPSQLLAIKVTGRSMEPSLYDGDLVIVNLDDTRLQDGQVFAANYEGELVIKRLKRDAQQWFLSSDSPDKIRFGDKRCTDGCGLLGRIVYRQTEHI